MNDLRDLSRSIDSGMSSLGLFIFLGFFVHGCQGCYKNSEQVKLPEVTSKGNSSK